jgi:hypothetical protein
MGRAGLINSGGESKGNDFEQAVTTAVINKRAGGMGLISGRKAFQRPMKRGRGVAQRHSGCLSEQRRDRGVRPVHSRLPTTEFVSRFGEVFLMALPHRREHLPGLAAAGEAA